MIKYLALTVAVVALIGAGAFLPMILGTSPSGGSTTSTTCTTSSATNTTQSSTTAIQTSAVQGSFTYTPSAPVRIDSVAATVYGQGSDVAFSVTYENVGSSSVYYVAGCGSSLVATVPPGSGVLQKVSSGPVCLCAEAIMPLAPGDNRTATTPGCWSGYHFELLGPGTVQVELTLYWGQSQGSQQDTTNATATFTFG